MLTAAQYDTAADEAVRSAEMDSHAFQRIANSRNLTVLLFLGSVTCTQATHSQHTLGCLQVCMCRNIKDILATLPPGDKNAGWAHNSFKELKLHHARVYDIRTLKMVKSCKSHCARVSSPLLWDWPITCSCVNRQLALSVQRVTTQMR